MGVASSPGPDRPYPRRRSIRTSFTLTVAVPVVCLVLLWALAVAFTPSGALVRHSLSSPGHKDLAQVALIVGAGLLVVIVAVVLMGTFAGRLSREIAGLEATARQFADEKLPEFVTSLHNDEGGRPAAEQAPVRNRARTAEVSRAAAAIANLQNTAVSAASDEASLRNGVAQVFVSLARRNQSLLQRQLRLIDTLERKATDPAALADLFLLDHLTTRMRRHAENLIILSGAAPGRSWSAPVPVIDVIRGAAAEVEDYQRIRVVTRTQDAVGGSAVADMIHLLAELIENAALFSPSGTRVDVRAERVANGFVIEIEDRGLGIHGELLRQINHQLLNPPDFGVADPDRLGLFVVAKLAARHGIRVSLNPSPYGGTTAVALVPHNLVLPASELGNLQIEAGPTEDGAPVPLERVPSEPVPLNGRAASFPPSLDDTPERLGASAARLLSPDSLSPDAFSPDPLGPDPLSSGPLAPPASGPFPAVPPQPRSGSPLDADFPASPPPPPPIPLHPAAQAPVGPPAPPPGLLGDTSLAKPWGHLSQEASGPSAGSEPPAARHAFGGNGLRSGPAATSGQSSRGPAAPDFPPSTGGSVFSSGPTQRSTPGGAAGTPPAGRGSTSAGTYRGLPRRVRQANLSPHLANSAPQDLHAAPVPTADPVADRTPEEARNFVASFRTGWQRDPDQTDTLEPLPGTGRAGEPQDPAAPPTEER